MWLLGTGQRGGAGGGTETLAGRDTPRAAHPPSQRSTSPNLGHADGTQRPDLFTPRSCQGLGGLSVTLSRESFAESLLHVCRKGELRKDVSVSLLWLWQIPEKDKLEERPPVAHEVSSFSSGSRAPWLWAWSEAVYRVEGVQSRAA